MERESWTRQSWPLSSVIFNIFLTCSSQLMSIFNRTPTIHRETGENSCRIWNGNRLRQKQNPRQQHRTKAIYQHMNECRSGRTSGPVHIPGINTNYMWNISKGSKYQIGASTLCHDMTRPAVFLQRLHSINHSSCQYCSQLDADCWSGEAEPSLWQQVPQEEVWRIMPRTKPMYLYTRKAHKLWD